VHISCSYYTNIIFFYFNFCLLFAFEKLKSKCENLGVECSSDVDGKQLYEEILFYK